MRLSAFGIVLTACVRTCCCSAVCVCARHQQPGHSGCGSSPCAHDVCCWYRKYWQHHRGVMTLINSLQVWKGRVHSELIDLLQPEMKSKPRVDLLVCDDTHPKELDLPTYTTSEAESSSSAEAESSSSSDSWSSLASPAPSSSVSRSSSAPHLTVFIQHLHAATAKLPHVGSFNAIHKAAGLSLASFFRAVYGGVLLGNPHFLERENRGGRVWVSDHAVVILVACHVSRFTTHMIFGPGRWGGNSDLNGSWVEQKKDGKLKNHTYQTSMHIHACMWCQCIHAHTAACLLNPLLRS